MLGLALHSWEDVMIFALAVVGAFGVIVGVATYAVVRMQRAELAASKIEFDTFKLEASNRADELRRDIAEAKAREAAALVKLEEVRRYAAPRLLDPNFETDIADIPRVPVEIWYAQEAADAQSFAFMIWESLRMVKWPASQPIPIPDPPPHLRNLTRTGAAGAGPQGVTIVIPSDAQRQPSGEPLMNALGKNNEYGAWISVNPAIPLPVGTFRIVVSAKPNPRLEYTPTTRPPRK